MVIKNPILVSKSEEVVFPVTSPVIRNVPKFSLVGLGLFPEVIMKSKTFPEPEAVKALALAKNKIAAKI